MHLLEMWNILEQYLGDNANLYIWLLWNILPSELSSALAALYIHIKYGSISVWLEVFFTWFKCSIVKTYSVYKRAIVISRLKLYPRRDIPKVQKMIGVICLLMVLKGRWLNHLQLYLNRLACRRKTRGWFMIGRNNRHGHWSSLYTVKVQEYRALDSFLALLFIVYSTELLICDAKAWWIFFRLMKLEIFKMHLFLMPSWR